MSKPFQHSTGYHEDQVFRELPRTLVSGSHGMREAARAGRYMWPHAGENHPYYLPGEPGSPGLGSNMSAFLNRVRHSSLRNVWLDSVKRSALAPMREPITWVNWPDRLMQWLLSMDGTAGKTVEQYMMGVLLNQAFDGIHFTLAELPLVVDDDGKPFKRSAAEDDKRGIRPYCVPLLAADVDPLAIDQIGAETVLMAAGVYLEDTCSSWDPLKSETKTALWRVYALESHAGDYRVQAKDYPLVKPERDAPINEKEITEWRPIVPQGSGTVLRRIPLVPFYDDFMTGPFRGRPQYGEAAETQATAFRKRSEKDDDGRRMRDRVFQNHVKLDEDDKPTYQMMKDFLYTSGEGSATGLYPTGNALKAKSEDLLADEQYIKDACRAVGARTTTGVVSATEIGLIGLESGTHTEATTSGNRASLATLAGFLMTLGGQIGEPGEVEWPFKAQKALSPEALERFRKLCEQGKITVESYIELEKLAGNVPRSVEIDTRIPKVE